MTISLKADAGGTFGEILVNGSQVAKFTPGGAAVIPGAVGTVSQSGGIPTGAVVERGSNANGEYVRFADGTQICTAFNKSITTAVNIAAEQAPFRSAANTLSFAAAFVAEPSVAANAHNTNINADTLGVNASTIAVDIILGRQTSSGSVTQPVNYIAIGRWF